MTSAKPSIAAVIPIHNGIEHTLPFLKSMEEAGYPNLVTVVVDDGSTDGSAEAIAAAHPKTIVLKGNGSLWWSGATNLGVEWAIKHKYDYVLTINNDVVIAPGSLEALIKVARARPKAVVGSIVRYAGQPERIWFAGAYFNYSSGEMEHQTELPSGHQPIFTDWLTGMGILIPVAAFKAVGLYDTKNFPQYFGDADFSLRAREKGYELLVVPDSILYADVSSSWLKRQTSRKAGFIKELLFSIKSPYNVMIRYKFYKRHWSKGHIKPLLRIYSALLKKGLNRRNSAS